MSAPIPEKDKTPLMLLTDRVVALEGNAQANEAVLLNWVKRSLATEELTRRQELELCQWSERYFTTHYAMVKEPTTTSDPPESYVLDTKPPADNYPKYKYGDMPKGCKYQIHFDPKASPNNIPFSVALEFMRAGRKVRHADWIGGQAVTLLGEDAFSFDGDVWDFSHTELLSNRWEVIPKP